MKKITLMITGASGFIGTNFINKYKEKYNIVPVDLLNEKPEELNFENIDCVLHLAALVHQMKGASRESYFEINTELTRRMAENAKKNGVRHFVFYSTVAVYGTHGSINEEIILDKNSSVNPKTPYAESKWKAEEILRKLESDFFKISIIRPPMVYGKNCPGNMKRLEKLVKVFPVLPFGNTENRRTLVDINKLLEITSKVINKMVTGIVIPRNEKDMSIKEILNIIVEEQNKKIFLIKLPRFIINIIHKIKPEIIESLYGNLCFR